MVRVPFQWFELAFECFKSCLNGSNLHSNGSNPSQYMHLNASNFVGRVGICIRMVQIPFDWFKFAFKCFEFAFKCFESPSNGSNLHFYASNLVRIFEFAFEWLGSFLTSSNLHSNVSNLFRRVRICIWLVQIPFEFAFESFELRSNGSNLHSNASNLFLMVRICIQMLRIYFEWLEFAFKCFESL